MDLLTQAGFDFFAAPADIDEEHYPVLLSPPELAEYLATEKARVIAKQYPSAVVLGADTVVALGDAILGKPEDAAHARWMLGQLAGSIHQVLTGVCVLCKDTGREHVSHSVSTVSMRPLSQQEIELYVASGDWRGKAGGYGLQDHDPFVTNMGGSSSNIVGLPMELATKMLADHGITPHSPA